MHITQSDMMLKKSSAQSYANNKGHKKESNNIPLKGQGCL
jgi:hypothetical protein